MKTRVLFVSSAEDLLIVDALIERLEGDFEPYAWTEDVFTLSENPLESLGRVIKTVDCAIFVARTTARRMNPNLVSELGYVTGYLGEDRVGVVSGSTTPRFLSDYRGSAHFVTKGRGESLSPQEVRELANFIRRWIKTLGRRRFRVSEHPAPRELLARKGSRPKTKRRTGGLFISYAHADARWLARIKTMLSPLLRGRTLQLWDDTMIKPGAKWRAEIKKAIDDARVALLLVSAPFLESPFIAKHELPPLLRAARRNGLAILWVYLSPCLVKNTAVAQYQAAHAGAKPLEGLTKPKRNQALLEIAENIAASLSPPKRSRRTA